MKAFGERAPADGSARPLRENPLSRPARAVPDDELTVEFTRSSGPGGQNVNKRSTRAQLRWRVGSSAAFDDGQKARIRAAAGHRLNAADEIVLASDDERQQARNRANVVRRLQELVAAALAPRMPRVATKVSRSQKRQRLESKRRQGDKKKSRREPRDEW